MRMAHRYATIGLVVAGLLATAPVRSTAQEPSFRYQLADREAYDNGFRDGLRHGEEDALNRRAYSLRQYQDYRDATLGYRPGDIELSAYQRAFREGFTAGYADAYDRTERGYPVAPRATERVPAPPPAEYITPAGQFGFRDGYDAGVKDARDRETYDPVRSDRYRDADHHYNNRYGSKEVFKRDYRVGFEQGYEQGYRVGR